MLSLPASVKIYLRTAATDLRKGHDGLAALVEQDLKADVFSGHLFAFVSRRGNRIKILTWERGGLILMYKRLEKGRFKIPAVSPEQTATQLDAGQLAMLLDGMDYSKVRRPTSWRPPRRR
jgi:transposase